MTEQSLTVESSHCDRLMGVMGVIKCWIRKRLEVDEWSLFGEGKRNSAGDLVLKGLHARPKSGHGRLFLLP